MKYIKLEKLTVGDIFTICKCSGDRRHFIITRITDVFAHYEEVPTTTTNSYRKMRSGKKRLEEPVYLLDDN